MKRFAPWKTLGGRLVLLALCVELLMLSLLVFNSIRLLYDAMIDQMRWQAAQMAPVLDAALTAPLAQRDFATVQAILDESRRIEGIDYLAVVNRSGQRVAASGWPSHRPLPEPKPIPSLLGGQAYDRYDIVVPIVLHGQPLGMLHFGLNFSKIALAKRSLTVQSVSIAAFEMLLSLVVLTLTGYWLTRHLVELTRASNEVAQGNLTPAMVREGGDDVGQLGSAFNAMSRALTSRIAELTMAKEMAERKERETELLYRDLNRQKALLDAILQSTSDLLFYKDLDGRYLGCNDAFCVYVGRPEGEIVGRSDYDLFPAENANFFREQDRLMFAAGGVRTNEEWISFPDGRRELVETKKSILRNRDETPIGVLGIARVITERKHRDQRIETLSQRLQLALRTAEAGIWEYDYGQQRLILDHAINTIIGRSDEVVEDVGAFVAEVVLARDLESLRERIDKEIFISGVRIGSIECRLVRSDGSLRHVRINALKEYDEEGKPKVLFGICWDITTIKLAIEQAEAASRAKSLFLATMSHEIRTPMGGVLGLTEILSKTELTDRQRGLVARLRLSGELLLAVINDILDFSRIESGEMVLESNAFSLDRDVVAKVIELYAFQARRKGLDFRVFMDPSLPAVLRGDPQRLIQILGNLLNNAVKFTEKGTIRLVVEVRERTAENILLVISVSDTGIGIRPEKRDNLFTPFWQADASMTRRYGGSGLGLAICNLLVNRMGGEMTVESEVGRGTTMHVLLPLTVLSRQGETTNLTFLKQGIRVLVVDDQPQQRQHLAEMLTAMQLEVAQAASGEEALQMLRTADQEQSPFTVCILDSRLADGDGSETAKMVAQEPLSRLPKLILTVTADPLEAIASDATGVLDAVFVKPVLPLVLYDKILYLLDNEGNERTEAPSSEIHFRHVLALVVEDHAINREIITDLLQRYGIDVEIALNGAEALAKVRERDYDIVLMDIQMPEMDGLAATRAIRALGRPEGGRLPILALTAHAFPEEQERSLEAGMNDHLTKPVDSDVFLKALLRWLPLEKRVTTKAATPPQSAVTLPGQVTPELDVVGALRRMSGNVRLYRKLLRDFATDHGDVPNRLQQVLAADRSEDAIRLVHSVKGIAASLGGRSLEAAARVLERILQVAPDGIPAALEEPLQLFGAAHADFLRDLQAFLAGEEEPPPVPRVQGPGTPEVLRSQLEALQQALQEDTPLPCRKILDALRQWQWPGETEAVLEELARLVGRYRLAEARERLRHHFAGLLREEGNAENG